MEGYLKILNLISANDPKGLELLYKGYGQKFYSYAVTKWQLDEDEAWEVVYKTFETLVLKLGNYEFESENHFNNFIYKVLLNFIRQYFRNKRKRDIEQIHYTTFDDDESSSFFRQHIDKQSFLKYYNNEAIDSPFLERLKTALGKLSDIDRDLLLLRAQNYTYDEIATFLGIENKQLKVKHLRAKQKLIDIINENTQDI